MYKSLADILVYYENVCGFLVDKFNRNDLSKPPDITTFERNTGYYYTSMIINY